MLNFWEEMGLTIFNAILRGIKFDPAKHDLMRKIFEPIRDELNTLYPPTTPTV